MHLTLEMRKPSSLVGRHLQKYCLHLRFTNSISVLGEKAKVSSPLKLGETNVISDVSMTRVKVDVS